MVENGVKWVLPPRKLGLLAPHILMVALQQEIDNGNDPQTFSGVIDWYNRTMTKNSKLKGTPLQDFTPLGKKNKVAQLGIIDLVEGSGDVVPDEATVTVHYTGALCTDGTIFESSHDGNRPVTFGLHEVISGWTQGVPGMKAGGTRRLIIPSELAYGQRRASSMIGPNSDLVFDIELISFENY
jgi:FKBP-type peptidyl-prolyl cis-trans isomerase